MAFGTCAYQEKDVFLDYQVVLPCPPVPDGAWAGLALFTR